MNYKILDDMKTTNIKKVNYSITSVLCTLFSVIYKTFHRPPPLRDSP